MERRLTQQSLSYAPRASVNVTHVTVAFLLRGIKTVTVIKLLHVLEIRDEVRDKSLPNNTARLREGGGGVEM